MSIDESQTRAILINPQLVKADRLREARVVFIISALCFDPSVHRALGAK